MNDKQNIADLIRALAKDIEEIKKKLDTQDSLDKDEAVKRVAIKLEPFMRFFHGDMPENISEIFGSKKAIEIFKKSLCNGVIVRMEEYTDATNKYMCKRGTPTIKELLHEILEMMAELLKSSKRPTESLQSSQGCMQKLWLVIRLSKTLQTVRRLWCKVPKSWKKHPYTWAGIGCTFVFFTLFTVSWLQWHE